MTAAPLCGIRVLDLTTGIPGAYCTKLLADGGADVVKVEPPGGDKLRRFSASGARLSADADGAMFQFLASSKRSAVLDLETQADRRVMAEMVGGADAVVWSPGSSVSDHPVASPGELVRAAPSATVVAITPFGLDGPWAGRPATEFTLQAWAGGLSVRGSPDRAPVSAGGRLGDWAAGVVAAIALLTSRQRTLETGVGELVDVSELETLCLTHDMYPVTYLSVAGRPRTSRRVSIPGIERTKDGWVGFVIITGQQWLDFCALVNPVWLEDESLCSAANRWDRRMEMKPVIRDWMAERTTAEIIESASLLRIPVAPIGTGATVVTFDHFVEEGFFVKNARDGFLQPDVPYRLGAGASVRPFAPAPRLGEDTEGVAQSLVTAPRPMASRAPAGPHPLPWQDLRVADFTAFWAGPIVGQVLGMFGADVIHIESPQRPDGMRANSIRRLSDPEWWEWAPLYLGANTNKRDLAIKMSDPRGFAIALELIEKCDVVIDNFTPRVTESWGLTYDAVKAARPDVIMVRMPAFGLSGPWRDRTGYAQTQEQVSGLAWLTGYPDDAPQVPNGPCDPIAGSHATFALLLALEHRRRTGHGMLVEVPMAGSALNVGAEQIVEYAAYGNLMKRDGNRSPFAAPQNLYRTADRDETGNLDRWVAIAVETDNQWDALKTGLGEPGWAEESRFSTVTGRRRAHNVIDQHLQAWCAARTGDEIVGRLWPLGVPVAKVVLPSELVELEQLVARNYFTTLDHPVVGRHLQAGYPARLQHGPLRPHRMPAPMLGQHNHDILVGLLGKSAAQVAELERDHVIGSTPHV